MNIEQVVAGMPKAENPFPNESAASFQVAGYVSLNTVCDKLLEAQCQLLAEQGYRKVPSVEQILYRLAKGSGGGSLNDANELHRWWMEGE